MAQRTGAGQWKPTETGNSNVRKSGAARRIKMREYMDVLGGVTSAVSAMCPRSLVQLGRGKASAPSGCPPAIIRATSGLNSGQPILPVHRVTLRCPGGDIIASARR